MQKEYTRSFSRSFRKVLNCFTENVIIIIPAAPTAIPSISFSVPGAENTNGSRLLKPPNAAPISSLPGVAVRKVLRSTRNSR